MSTPLRELDEAISNMTQPDSSGISGIPNINSKKISVPSKSVRERKKEDHKRHLNKKVVQNRLNPRLDAKRHISEDDLAAVLEECRRTAMQQPVREFEVKVDTDALTETCKNTVQYLYTVGKVPACEHGGFNTDVANLKKVVVAQASTKISLARRHNGKLVNVADSDYSTRVEKRFNVLPKVLNVYLEQIGHLELDGQVFVPKKLPPLTFGRLAAGQYMTTMSQSSPDGEKRAIAAVPPEHVATYVVDDVVNDPMTMLNNGHGTLNFVPIDSIGDFHSLCTWYEEFTSRCSKKAGNMMQDVVFGKGEGTAAQLVGSRYDERIHQMEIWCVKKIDQNTLQIGGLFAYGFESDEKFHDEDLACITDRIDTEGMYQRIQRCQKL